MMMKTEDNMAGKEIFGTLKKADDKYTIIASTATPDRDD